jgi:glucose-1-phosphate cytidylyltransferase
MANDTPSVVILCGGMSTRMRGETTTKKEMVEIGGRPILWHVMKIYASQGFTDFVLALGHHADEIKTYFLNYGQLTRDLTINLGVPGSIDYHEPHPDEGWRITMADTGLDVMTGARLRKAMKYVTGDRLLATYGDGVANIDLSDLLAFHQRMGCLATVTGVRAQSRFGILSTDGKGLVTSFDEKPMVESLINGGFFVFESGAAEYLAGGDEVVLERDPLQRLAADGQLAVYEHTGFWRAMDTFKDAQQMSALWREQQPWKTW